MSWQGCVSQATGAFLMADANAYVGQGSSVRDSSIDRYYNATEAILTQIQPSYFQDYSPQISSLLYVGLISATENFFRDVLGFILGLCPIARNKAAEEKVQLGSYLWGGSELHSRTAFDFIAFSSGKNVSETMAKFIGHQIKQAGVWKAMLSEYDRLCEIRHGIVHSGLVLSGKNALRLGLRPTSNSMLVSPNYATLQEAGGICTTLVQAANNELFEALVKRWAEDWRRLPAWQAADARKLLKKIYSGFYSMKDASRGAIANSVGFETFFRRVCKDFNV